jgi:DNA-binding transcriptional ArsR family regulator
VDIDYTKIGRLLASSARSAMLGLLLDGRPASGTALARCAGVAPSTASEHLRALVDGGLVSVVADGRQRHYTIASPEIAEALEALARVCPRGPIRSLRSSEEASRLGFARTCYDHLAGQVGVSVLEALLDAKWVVPARELYELGPEGARFSELGIDAEAVARERRAFARPCLDATERRPHLAGALGAALCGAALERGWFVRTPRGRGLRITDLGARHLARVLDLHLDDDAGRRAVAG